MINISCFGNILWFDSKRMMEWIKDQDQRELKSLKSLKSVEVLEVEEDAVEKQWYSVPISQNSVVTITNAKNYNEDAKDIDKPEDVSQVQTTIWTRIETLALINIYSLHKDEFRQLKNKKGQWPLVSKELLEIGIDKAPRKCEIKWRNLLRSYRNYKNCRKERGKFDFFNDLDIILTNDPQFNGSLDSTTDNLPSVKVENNIRHLSNTSSTTHPSNKKTKCCCTKTDKQKRHEDRMALLKKKVEIEERKVEAFEEYLNYLKNNS